MAFIVASALFLSPDETIHSKFILRSRAEGPKGEQFKILFGGDTAFAESYGKQQMSLLEKKGYEFSIARLKPMLTNSDFVICNLETPITDLKESPYINKKRFIHWTHTKYAPKTYKANKMLTFSLANNHTLDYGIAGLRQTIAVMKENSLSWFGAGLNEEEAKKPLLRTFRVGNNDFKIAVIGAFEYNKEYDLTYNFYADKEKGGCYKLHLKAIREQITKLKAENPNIYVVIYPHWGRNYTWKTRLQTKLGHSFIKAGADLVIGHGAHGMQEIELYRGRWIFYSTGNFVFLTAGRYKKKKYPPYSFVTQLILSEENDKLGKWMRVYPIYSNNLVTNFQPRPLAEEEFDDFVNKLLEKSPLPRKIVKGISKGRDGVGNYLQFKLD